MFYVDSSAAVKLVVEEADSRALGEWLAQREGHVCSSDLLRTELVRATRRLVPGQLLQARAVLDSLVFLSMSFEIFERAANLEPVGLRNLDALHLSAALELGDELEGMVTYDARQSEAGELLGISVVAPGVES